MTEPSRHTVVIVTSSYPRFPGDLTGTAVAPIARGIAERGHAVHVVAPWHPLVRRDHMEDGIHYHFYRYAPVPLLNVFGYAGALRADVSMKWSAYAAAPFAFVAGVRMVRRVVREHGATLIHAHWAIPSGTIAASAAGDLPLVISLHGSDIFLAEHNRLARWAARRAFRRADRVTGCSADLRDRAAALGADGLRAETLLHGVDANRFMPSAETRARVRAGHGIGAADPVVFAVGRLVRKKGFEYLIDAVASLAPRHARLRLVIAGGGDLDAELRERAVAGGMADRVTFLGSVAHGEVADWLATADIAAAPSVVDDAGNVDGLPNTVLEALASATPVVVTLAGGIGAVAVDGETALIVPERDAAGLAGAIEALVQDPALGERIGRTARRRMRTEQTWTRVAERFEEAYALAAEHRAAVLMRG